MARQWFSVIVAGGTGNRFGGPTPKQFLILDNKSILRHSIDTFFQISGLEKLVIATHTDWIAKTESIVESTGFQSKIQVVKGGNTRQQSCFNGLSVLPNIPDAPVLIHDAARPWVSVALIRRVLQSTAAGHCVIPAIPATDSIIQTRNGLVDSYPDRNSIGYVQTPQGFPLKVILSEHRTAQSEFSTLATDDGSLVHGAGYPVLVVPGETRNKKITERDDLL